MQRVAVVTGASSGIGKETAKALAAQGWRVIAIGRDPGRTAAAEAELHAAASGAPATMIRADLALMAQAARAAAEIEGLTDRIDVLVNNAGGVFAKRQVSKDGYEMTFAVNHLAPFLLTQLLLGTVKSAAPSRIVNTSSAAHKGARIPFDDLQATGKYSAMGAYGTSKLANILFTRALAKRLQGTTVTATCFHPGFVRTSFGRGFDANPIAKHLFRWVSRFARTPEKGAETLVYLAASPEVDGASGGYYFDCKLTTTSAAAQDDAAAERLWQVSEQLVGS
jgi:retinol dehydrogenase 12